MTDRTPIGWVYLGVRPDVSQFGPGLRGQLPAPMAQAGSESGHHFGLAFVGAAAGYITYKLGGSLASFSRDAVGLASSAQQSLGATQGIFGDFAKKVVNTSQRASTAFGLSANDYRENANLIGALFKNQGVATDELGEKTKSIIRLGADLSATYGGSASQAVEALTSAYKGEFDPLEKYGISVKQSTINTEALAVAHVKTSAAFKKLTVEQRTSAVQVATTNLLYKQTTDAQGQFAKQTNTLAEQQQIAGAEFENAKKRLGMGLLPVVTDFTRFLADDAIPVVDRFSHWFKDEGAPGIEDFAKKLQPVVDDVLPLVKAGFANVSDFIDDQGLPALQRFSDWFHDDGSREIGDFAEKLKPLGESLIPALNTGLHDARDILSDAVPFAKKLVDTFNGMPDWAQKAIVGGVVIGGAVSVLGGGGSGGATGALGGGGGGSLIGSAISHLLQRGSYFRPMWVQVKGGIPGAGGAGGGGINWAPLFAGFLRVAPFIPVPKSWLGIHDLTDQEVEDRYEQTPGHRKLAVGRAIDNGSAPYIRSAIQKGLSTQRTFAPGLQSDLAGVATGPEPASAARRLGLQLDHEVSKPRALKLDTRKAETDVDRLARKIEDLNTKMSQIDGVVGPGSLRRFGPEFHYHAPVTYTDDREGLRRAQQQASRNGNDGVRRGGLQP